MKLSLFTIHIAILLILTACSSNHKVEFVEAADAASLDSVVLDSTEDEIVEAYAIEPLSVQRRTNARKVSRRKNDVQSSTTNHASFASSSEKEVKPEEVEPTKINHPALVKETYEELGVNSPEADLDFISNEQIAARFEDFVNTVDKNKKIYSAKDWNEVDAMWESLIERNKELKKVKLKDRLIIGRQRTKYTLMKSFRSTASKM